MKQKFLAIVALAALLIPLSGTAQGTSPCGPSDPSPKLECGDYQWPEVQSACPEVQIKQKHDHSPKDEYLSQGWDTAVTCAQHTIILSCMPYIPTQYFNGQYTVDTIPYDPPDTTFYLDGKGIKMDITQDDRFAPSSVELDYPFFFFGEQKKQFRIGDNGIVTFITDSAYKKDTPYSDHFCPWEFSVGLPWKSNTTGAPDFTSFNRMHDAIYGVYQDTHVLEETVKGNQGIYYGVVDEKPCRKIIASWNEIPLFASQTSNRSSYQIVCYEGSNIIEVHIKKRTVKTDTNDGLGLIGIQNAKGTLQKQGEYGTISFWVKNNSPAAFYPSNRNGYKTSESNTAYRFTPQGSTLKTYKWYRIFDNGQDSIELTTNPSDTNGYYTPMDESSTCPTLTTATVSPKCVSRYVFQLRFQNANKDWYNLFDTITVGVDTSNTTILHATGDATNKKDYNLCEGQPVQMELKMPALQVPTHIIYRTTRISNGQAIVLDTSASLNIGALTQKDGFKTQSVSFAETLPTEGKMNNKVDSILVQVSVEFASGCNNYDTLMIRIFPNFDTIEKHTICQGEQFIWQGKPYTTTTTDVAKLVSTPGCDSIVHLDLKVMNTSLTIFPHEDCQPYTWINGVTYEATNAATSPTDTVMLKNQYGCDSIVQLDFTLYPLEAKIQADRQSLTYDDMTVNLADISKGSTSRIWHFPNGESSTSSITSYTATPDQEEVKIILIAHSKYGCDDSTSLTLPLRKETFWVPNIFTPEQQNGNNVFHSVSKKTISQEMFIYNRQGSLVYSCEGVDCPWDGRDYNGNPCPKGTYVYFIRYTNEFEPLRTHVVKGTITLIR